MKNNILSISCLFILVFAKAQSPAFQWAKSMGGVVQDHGYAITVDGSGNVYTTGAFQATVDFDPGLGTYSLTAASNDIFVSKLDASGNFVWAKQLGGTLDDYGFSILIDPSGNIYTVGYFQGTADFDPGAGIFNLVSAGGFDIFVSKLDALGNFLWAKDMGGTAADGAKSVAVDALGNIFVNGFFSGTADFDPSAVIFNLTSSGLGDMFIAKLDASGNFVWAKNIGGAGSSDYAFGLSISIDALDNIYTAGNFQNTVDFDPGVGTINLTASGINDAFVSKLDASGNFIWAKQIGGTLNDYGTSVKVDASGNVHLIGDFVGTVDFDPGAGTFNLISGGCSDIFVSKLDASGNLIWAKQIGSIACDHGNSITLDAMGDVYTTGYFTKTADFDPNAGIFNLSSDSANTNDIFISKLDASGNFVWAENIGGVLDDEGNSISVDASNNVYATGGFQNTADFDFGAGVDNLVSIGSYDTFIIKISQTPSAINENIAEENFILYPSPANDFIYIESNLKNGSFSLFDITGKVILQEKIIQNKTRIDLSSYSNGLYFIQLQNDGRLISKKFIKQ